MVDGSAPDVRFGDGTNLQSGLDTCGNAFLLQNVCDGKTVHNGTKHPHMVGAGTLHAAASVLGSAPEVPGTDDDADLDAHGDSLFDDIGNFSDDFKIKARMFLARQGLPADFQKDSLIFYFLHRRFPPIFLRNKSSHFFSLLYSNIFSII